LAHSVFVLFVTVEYAMVTNRNTYTLNVFIVTLNLHLTPLIATVGIGMCHALFTGILISKTSGHAVNSASRVIKPKTPYESAK